MDIQTSLTLGAPPRPTTLEETGLGRSLVEELVIKHLHKSGVLDLQALSKCLRLAGMVLEPIINFMRDEGRIELRRRVTDKTPHYALTEKGQAIAAHALNKNQYIGPAPVPLAAYVDIVQSQSIRNYPISQAAMQAAFADAVISQVLLDQIGPAVHSGRAVFFYGMPGTGKSYIGRRLIRLFKDAVFIPHALAINDIVIPFFDPTIHHKIEAEADLQQSASLEAGYDPRFILCHRPVVVTGGELTLDMLEIQFDESRRQYRMPVQFLANNGVFMVDDLGRQRVAPADLLNRWIVPMEEHRDYLYISGQHFSVLLDMVLVFATNMNPLELADDAFLRRLGYKIRFTPLQAAEYNLLWQRECEDKQVPYQEEIVRYAQDALHKPWQVPLLPCHPRDLLNLMMDYCQYLGKPHALSQENLEWAWNTYFVRLE